MEDLKKEYEKILLERKSILDKINILAENESVKKYFSLCKQNNKLANQEMDLYKRIKVKEYSSCNHMWITILHDYDRAEGRSYNYYGCVKCGLNERPKYLMGWYSNPDELKPDDKIMYDYLQNHGSLNGNIVKLFCDLNLANSIYSKIKNAHPNIDDETAIKFLKVALHNIRDINVSDERKKSRAKRLSLNPNYFNKKDI